MAEPEPNPSLFLGSAASVPDSDKSSDLRDRAPKIVRFNSLCVCGDEIWIEHDGQIYRLRKTKQNKLILTK